MSYGMSDVISDLNEIGEDRRAAGLVTFNDLVQALEEALLQDGNRRKAMAVLMLARRQLDMDAWAERVLKDAKHRG